MFANFALGASFSTIEDASASFLDGFLDRPLFERLGTCPTPVVSVEETTTGFLTLLLQDGASGADVSADATITGRSSLVLQAGAFATFSMASIGREFGTTLPEHLTGSFSCQASGFERSSPYGDSTCLVQELQSHLVWRVTGVRALSAMQSE